MIWRAGRLHGTARHGTSFGLQHSGSEVTHGD
jgi:hypothetical protein